MGFEFASAALGAMIGLVSGLGGIALSHRLTEGRELRSRSVSGLYEVIRELEKRRRLSLDIAQHINTFAYTRRTNEEASIFDQPGWKEATLALHERPWVFPCLAYLPSAKPHFERLDELIHLTMEWAEGTIDEPTYDSRILAIHATVREIQSAVEAALATLLPRPK